MTKDTETNQDIFISVDFHQAFYDHLLRKNNLQQIVMKQFYIHKHKNELGLLPHIQVVEVEVNILLF